MFGGNGDGSDADNRRTPLDLVEGKRGQDRSGENSWKGHGQVSWAMAMGWK